MSSFIVWQDIYLLIIISTDTIETSKVNGAELIVKLSDVVSPSK